MTTSLPGQAKAAPPDELGLYVHVPFCASTCDFCAFYQEPPTAAAIRAYLEGIEAEAALVDWPGPATTVFFGGGTPGMLAPRDLARLGRLALTRVAKGPVEWTVELAPGSVNPERLAVLRDCGVTRLSLGVQSFQPRWLESLGRRHSRAQILKAYGAIRSAGWDNVNLDLMFALPGQTEQEWEADIAEAVALAPEHLSTYCLTFEEDAALWAKLSQGKVRLDPEREARLYEATWQALARAGYEQYEISNFARPGRACRHNLNTWAMREWVGLGPSAASQHGGWRGANVADLDKWRSRVAAGERMTEDRTRLTAALLAEDALIFGLRMNAGVDLAPWRARCPQAPWGEVDRRLERLVAEGLALFAQDRVRLTARGRLVADSVGAELMQLSSVP